MNSTSIGEVLRLRSMKEKDIGDVVTICALSFPESLRWTGPRFYAERWWVETLNFASCEAVICEFESQVVGFVLLITDIDQYFLDSKQLRRKIVENLVTLGCCYRLLFNKLIMRVKMAYSTPSVVICHQRENTPSSEELLWIELLAVIQNMRGMQVSDNLFDHSIERACELHRSAVKLRVDIDNKSALSFYRRMGFKKDRQTSGQWTLIRYIEKT